MKKNSIAIFILFLLFFFFFYDRLSFKSITKENEKTNQEKIEKENQSFSFKGHKPIAKLERDLNSNSYKLLDLRKKLNGHITEFTEIHKEFDKDPNRIFKKEIDLLSKIKAEMHNEEHIITDRNLIIEKMQEFSKHSDEYEITKLKELFSLDKDLMEKDNDSMKNILALIQSQIESDREKIGYLQKEKQEEEKKEKQFEEFKEAKEKNYSDMQFMELYDNYEWTWSPPSSIETSSNLIPLPR